MNDYFGVAQVWTRREWDTEHEPPAMRVMASVDHPGDFVLQLRALGRVVSVRLSSDQLREVHRQAVDA